MKLPISVQPGLGLVAAMCVLTLAPLAAQQNNGNQQKAGTAPAAGSQQTNNGNGAKPSSTKFKQDFGPQPTPPRGSRANAATPPQNAETRTEKFKVKQEFGPQTGSRRGDATTTVTPPSQGNTQSGATQNSPSSTTANKPGKQPAPAKPKPK
jgi:hypothetical protein